MGGYMLKQTIENPSHIEWHWFSRDIFLIPSLTQFLIWTGKYGILLNMDTKLMQIHCWCYCFPIIIDPNSHFLTYIFFLERKILLFFFLKSDWKKKKYVLANTHTHNMGRNNLLRQFLLLDGGFSFMKSQ